MKLFRHLKEKRYLILAFTLPALLLALAIVFFRPTHHAEVGVRVSTKQSSSKAKASSKSSSSSSSSVSRSSESSSSSTASVAASRAQAATTTTVTPAPSSAQGTYQAPQYNYAPPTTYTESQNDASTSTIYNGDVNSTVAE
jgi:cytoskeletal protein RodZ